MGEAIDLDQAREIIGTHAFRSTPPGQVGLELEWLVVDLAEPARRPNPAEVRTALGDEPLSAGVAVSFEPGGQLELSTAPGGDLADCLALARSAVTVVRARLAAAGLALVGDGLDHRPPQRLVRHPRYDLLEHSYRPFGPAGLIMMCNTASVQVNLDAGDDSAGPSGWRHRWWLANQAGPVFVAMFANSPAIVGDAGTRRTAVSGRQVIRFHTDASRTDPLPRSDDPRTSWTEYALDARVVGIPDHGDTAVAPPPGLTLRRWIVERNPRACRTEDVFWHLRTVIPPVRARGYLELRMIDAQPADYWTVPAAVVTALLDDSAASSAAGRLVERLPWPDRRDWLRAAYAGLTEPVLAETARGLMELAQAALERCGTPPGVRAEVERFAAAYTRQGRCPADDRPPTALGPIWARKPATSQETAPC